MAAISNDIRFDLGIELIVDAQSPLPNALPDATGLKPGTAEIRDRLSELLAPNTIEQLLVEACRPECKHRELLTPGGWQSAAAMCKRDLETFCKRPLKPDDKEKLTRLMQQLEGNQNLVELLTRLRQLLHQA